ncbi:hypothetical protein EVB79_024 [Rhizobium phage RHph_N3_13]|nr:hypothetical protein EVB79_024 [Rhizobium phage RHph_N3_13]
MTYRMTSLSVGDRLVFNDDPSITNAEQRFHNNIVGRLDDEYICLRAPSRLDRYADDPWGGEVDLVIVSNVRTGEQSSGFWWRFKSSIQEYKYDQTGDTDEDI